MPIWRRLRTGAGVVTLRRPNTHPPAWGTALSTQVDDLRAGGSGVDTIFPDSEAEHLFGANAMDPSLRAPAAQAGYDQGRARAESLAEIWR
jgi:NTE family protein